MDDRGKGAEIWLAGVGNEGATGIDEGRGIPFNGFDTYPYLA